MSLKEQLIEQLDQLEPAQQVRVLNFARILAQTHSAVRGEQGESIVKAVGFFDAASLDEIETAIKNDTEEIDWRGWE